MMNHPALKYPTLEAAINGEGGSVGLLRKAPVGTFLFPVVAPYYSNWQDEQRAWMNDVALLNLSHHMTSLYLKGPDVLKYLKTVGCNKFGTFPINRGKQIILANPDGHLIADGIAFHTSDDLYRVIGGAQMINWMQYQAEIGDFDIELERDENSAARKGDPRLYIYQIQGPRALDLMRDVCGDSFPDIKFFHIGEFEIAGRPARALRHGMASLPGFEVFGPWSDHEFIMQTFEKAGEKYNMKKVGGVTYPSTCLESAWISRAVPAVYAGESMKAYREWIKPPQLETVGSLGGSFFSENITDYYLDPVEVGYGPFIDVDNPDFIGREAVLEKLANQKRKKVTLVYNQEDVSKVMAASVFSKDAPARPIAFPISSFTQWQYDSVMKDGKQVGVAVFSGGSANAREMLALAIVDLEHAEPGTEVEVLWGDPNSIRPADPKHVIHTIRARVENAPYIEKTNKTENL